MSFQDKVVNTIGKVLSSEEYREPLADLQRRYEEGQKETMRGVQLDNRLNNSRNDVTTKYTKHEDLEER